MFGLVQIPGGDLAGVVEEGGTKVRRVSRIVKEPLALAHSLHASVHPSFLGLALQHALNLSTQHPCTCTPTQILYNKDCFVSLQ